MRFNPFITFFILFFLNNSFLLRADDESQTTVKKQENEAAVDPYDQIEDESHPEENEEVDKDFQIPKAPLDVAGPPVHAQRTESGLAFRVLTPGDGGDKPGPDDIAEVHFTGWTTDGKVVDSSLGNDEPLKIVVNDMMPGWIEGVQMMSAGEERRFWIPAELAFGDEPEDGEPAGMLVFDIELLAFEPPFTPPADALKTKAGLAYEIKKKGEGNVPSPKDNVTFHVVETTPSGMVLEDTRRDDSPFESYLPQVPLETRQILSEMKAGEVRTVWISNPKIMDGFMIVELELLATGPAPEVPDAPENLTQIPTEAEVTQSGISSLVLKKGAGKVSPQINSTVTAHYIVWEANGEVVDTTISKRDAATFPLKNLPTGMQEGVELMVAGEKRRFWIPQELAYGPKEEGSGQPGGLLICEIELVAFE